jgi:adenosylhomocysteine nucleosidase
MLLIVAALEREIACLRTHAWRRSATARLKRWTVRRWRLPEGDLAVVVTGVGEDSSRDALIALDTRFQPSAIISVGYAGATTPELGVGDICVATALHMEDGDPAVPHPASLEIARASSALSPGRPWHFGESFTAASVVSTRAEKEGLAQRHGVQWVDMESAVVGRLASRFAVPWLSIRAISDALDDDLVAEATSLVGEGGRSLRGRALRHILTNPGHLPAALRLRRQAHHASRALGEALDILIPRFLGALNSEKSGATDT